MRGRETQANDLARRLVLVALGMTFFALAALMWPSQARAQYPCESPGCRPLCVAGPDDVRPPTPAYTLTLVREGLGDGSFAVSALNPYPGASYNTNKGTSECASDPESDDTWLVKQWCTFHCEHRHYYVRPDGDPIPATARVTATATSGSFLGWKDSPCAPPTDPAVDRRVCTVRMSEDRTVTANFGLAADEEPPTAPALAVTNRFRYSIELGLTGSTDDVWLGGYELYRDAEAQPFTRVAPGLATFRATGLFCNRSYTFRVVAFDSQNVTPSNTVSTKTTQCVLVPPNGVFHTKPARHTRKRSAYFHWGAMRRGHELERFSSKCRVDKRAWARCSSVNGKFVRNLKPGWHTFRVRVGDVQGWDPTPAVWRWRVRR